MRERLESIIGQPAYHVSIHTFHSFGGEVINQNPDYFTKRQMLQQIDELGRYELLRNLFEELPHSNPLSTKVGDNYIFLKDTLSVISWLKQNGLAPNELHEIINANKKFIDATADDLAETFNQSPSPKFLGKYNNFLKKVRELASDKRQFGFPDYATECAAELTKAIEDTSPDGRFAPKITAWRNRWCQKNAAGEHIFKDAGTALRKMHAIGNIYKKLLDEMSNQGLYDFDDMIIEVVHNLETNDELRLNLQERYQYVLVDEFQDTNKAQLRMLNALGDNPIYEGRPNIMAVGDDDQAIYSFQGAEVSNMVAFAKTYRDPVLITLKNNYRSSEEILNASFAVAEQISDRLDSILPATHKNLTVRSSFENKLLEHNVFPSELAQYDWVAYKIRESIKKGLRPEQIAVIAPRHKYLERLVPYLANCDIPVAYERRENILDTPIVNQLLTMARLVGAVEENRQLDVDNLFSKVLGFDFWDISTETLLEISINCYKSNEHWLPVLQKHEDKKIKDITDWFLNLARRSPLEPMEYVLDQLTGTVHDGVDNEYDAILLASRKKERFISPLKDFYFNVSRYENATDSYLALLGQLSTLRHRLRQWKPNHALYIKDLVEFADLHESANLKIIDTNPHTQTTNAVQVMTAYKAKGLEFEAVFAINAQDEIWGPTAKSRWSTISLPKNIPISPAQDGDDDKLRLLFVAMTRAKRILHVTSYSHNLDNKLSPGLSFIGGNNPDSQPVHPNLTAKFIDKPATAKEVEILSTDWTYRFRNIIADKPTLFEPILANYKLSVTHLNNFIDVAGAGPEYFLIHNLLRFPEALTPAAAYGDAIHKTMQWLYIQMREENDLPPQNKINYYFSDILSRKHLRKLDFSKLNSRGHDALERYIQESTESYVAKDLIERGFNNEGVVIADAKLSGKIDKLHFRSDSSVEVIDFKTGKPATSWYGKDEIEKIKLHKYRQQLMFYKILVENSASYGRRFSVNKGALNFIEADTNGKMVQNLEINFEPEEIGNFIKLISAVWKNIMNLDFPNTSQYPKTLKGIQAFEQDLINKK
jgi:DNA helicase II / ATP-dependent DNA helicase PcrA